MAARLGGVLLLATFVTPAFPAEFQRVWFPSGNKPATVLTGFLFRPTGAGPFPAIVALHGCSGPGAASRELSKRHADWAERLVRAG
jgi:dienelactone hydrolase